jgi:xylose isomerase
MIGYKEYYGIEINPERMPVDKAIKLNARALEILNQRINKLPHEKIINAYFYPEENRGIIEKVLLDSIS